MQFKIPVERFRSDQLPEVVSLYNRLAAFLENVAPVLADAIHCAPTKARKIHPISLKRLKEILRKHKDPAVSASVCVEAGTWATLKVRGVVQDNLPGAKFPDLETLELSIRFAQIFPDNMEIWQQIGMIFPVHPITVIQLDTALVQMHTQIRIIREAYAELEQLVSVPRKSGQIRLASFVRMVQI
jgi:hypothetical protein